MARGSPPSTSATRGATLPAAGYTVRGGALVAWRRAERAGAAPLRVVGAHTDSPGLRIKPRPDIERAGLAPARRGDLRRRAPQQLARPRSRRSPAGSSCPTGPSPSSMSANRSPACRSSPSTSTGRSTSTACVLDRQAHLTPVWGTAGGEDFAKWIAARAGTAEPAWWELCLYDVQPAAVLGADGTLLASGRLDNQVSCWAATTALAAGGAEAAEDHVSMIALFDHEEVGSGTTSGASGPFLAAVDRAAPRGCRRQSRRPPPHPRRIELRVGGQRPRRPPELPGAARSRPRPARQPRPGDQAQRQPALRHVGGDGGAVRGGVRPGRCAPADLRVPQQHAVRLDDRPADRHQVGHRHRRRRRSRSCRCTRRGRCAASPTRCTSPGPWRPT